MNNPFDKSKNEAAYLAWEHGLNSASKDDNPYMDMMDDPEAAKLSSAWLQGFNSNKKRPKATKKAAPEPELDYVLDDTSGPVTPVVHTSGYLHVEPLSVDQQLQQLKQTAKLELAQLEQQNKELFAKINKLKTILEL